MFLAEIVLYMIVMISLKLIINTTLESNCKQFEYNKDRKELLYMKFHLITVMDLLKIV